MNEPGFFYNYFCNISMHYVQIFFLLMGFYVGYVCVVNPTYEYVSPAYYGIQRMKNTFNLSIATASIFS